MPSAMAAMMKNDRDVDMHDLLAPPAGIQAIHRLVTVTSAAFGKRDR
jgi:hypothetical protein